VHDGVRAELGDDPVRERGVDEVALEHLEATTGVGVPHLDALSE
jgi:hypothetical protein